MAAHEAPRKALPPFLDFFLLGSFLSFLLFSPWFYGLTRFRDQLTAEVLVLTLFLIAIPFLDREDIFKPETHGIDLWILLSLVLGIFYTLFSVLPYWSFLAFLRLLGCALFYGLIRSVVRTEARFRFFLWALLFFGVFYSLYGLAQYYGYFAHSYWYQANSLASRYVNGGHFAVFLLFPWFIGMSLFLSSRNGIAQGILSLLLLVILWSLLLTRSRAVWLTFLIGLLIFMALAWRSRLLNEKVTIGIILLAVGGVVLFFRVGGWEEIMGRFKGLWQTMDTSLASKEVRFYTLLYRWRLWQGAWQAISERPWGWGLGTFSAIFPQFRVHADRFVIDYAHNELMQVGVDLGIPGILFLVGFLFYYLWRAFSFVQSRQTGPSEKAIGIGFVALWICLILSSQVDFPLRIYANSFFFSAFLALSAFLFRSSPRAPRVVSSIRLPRFVFRLVSFLLVLLFLIPTTRQLLAQVHFERGQSDEKNFAWQKSLKEYERATRLAPFHAGYHLARARLYQTKAGISLNRNEKEKLRGEAIRSFQEATRLQPYESLYHYWFALLYEEGDEVKQAQSEFLKAISNDPTNFVFITEYGYFAVRHSWTEEAIKAFVKLKEIPGREVSLGDILNKCYGLTQDYQKLMRVVPDTPEAHYTFGILLAEKGQLDLAKKEFNLAIQEKMENPNPDRNELRSVLLSIGEMYASHSRTQDALETYQKMIAMNPQDQEALKKLRDISVS